uniref:Uncharacterized protein n=1 Tax=Aster yellows phytoplasma TaxID=35779 RepID=Q847Q3_ASTYP|nr:hypothetical protein [Aster yellows phytoplasma]
MFIDKFYRLYNPYNKPAEPRASNEPTLNLQDDSWNCLNRKIGNAKDGEFVDDVSTLGQTLTRKGDVFLQGKTKYEFLESKNKNWNAKKQKITNVEKGESLDDVPTLQQTLIRKDFGTFVQDNNNYEFFESENGVWNAKKRKITNVEKGESLDDVPTLQQTLIRKDDKFVQDDNNYEFLESENGVWNAKKQKISDLMEGTDSKDAVNVSQVPKMEAGYWDFNNKRLVRVKPAIDDTDCVTKEQTITFDKKEKGWDAKKQFIRNLPKGEYWNDICLMSQAMYYDGSKFVYGGRKFNLMEYNPDLLVADPTSLSGFKYIDNRPYIPENYVFKRMEDNLLIGANGNIFTVQGKSDVIKNEWNCIRTS